MASIPSRQDLDEKVKAGLSKRLFRECQKHRSQDANIDYIKSLIHSGADIHYRGKYNATPLIWAAWRDTPDAVNYLLDHSAHINDTDDSGTTPLIHAVFWGQYLNVETLLARGADLSCKDNNGKTALDWAQKKGYTQMAKIIQKEMHRRTDFSKMFQTSSKVKTKRVAFKPKHPPKQYTPQ